MQHDSEELDWDIVYEHVDESGFLHDVFERGLASPLLTLDQLERYPEQMLRAHVDALVLMPASSRVCMLVDAFASARSDLRLLTTLSAVALRAGLFDVLAPALESQEPGVQQAVARAVALHASSTFDAWLLSRLENQAEAYCTATLLELAAVRQLTVPGLLRHLQDGDTRVVAAATKCARFGDSTRHRPIVEWLLDHDCRTVGRLAVVCALAWRSRRAWQLCEELARGESHAEQERMLYAALGGPREHLALAEQLGDVARRRETIRALGFSGNVAMIPVLLEFVRSREPEEAKLAAQALSTILGFGLRDDRFAVTDMGSVSDGSVSDGVLFQDDESRRSLPPLEQDDLDADLVPSPEAELPQPNPETLTRFCEERAAAALKGQRLLYGVPCDGSQLLHAMLQAPMSSRHALALVLGIRLEGKCWVDTRALASAQRLRIRGLGGGAARSDVKVISSAWPVRAMYVGA